MGDEIKRYLSPEAVLVNSLDVRGSSTVDDAACQIRAHDIGVAFVEWFMLGNAYWQWHVPWGPPPGAKVMDLRVALLRRLGAKKRRSHTREHLKVDHPEGRSVRRDGLNMVLIGQDLMEWHQREGTKTKLGNCLLAVLLNHAWGLYHTRKEKRHGG